MTFDGRVYIASSIDYAKAKRNGIAFACRQPTGSRAPAIIFVLSRILRRATTVALSTSTACVVCGKGRSSEYARFVIEEICLPRDGSPA